MGPFTNRLTTMPKRVTALPLAHGKWSRWKASAWPKSKGQVRGWGMGISLSNWQPFPLLPCPRDQASWSSCWLPRVLRWAEMTQLAPLAHSTVKSPRWAMASDLLCSGEAVWCRIILVHSYCHELDALWEHGHKPLICWVLELQSPTSVQLAHTLHSASSERRGWPRAVIWLFSADSTSSCSILRSWEERTIVSLWSSPIPGVLLESQLQDTTFLFATLCLYAVLFLPFKCIQHIQAEMHLARKHFNKQTKTKNNNKKNRTTKKPKNKKTQEPKNKHTHPYTYQ